MLSRLIEELVAQAGMTEAEIASSVGTTQPTINRIRRGSGTSFDLGRKLVDLHAERLPATTRKEATA